MPWVLIPFLFLYSYTIYFTNDVIQYHRSFANILLIPISIYLGLRYQQKGVITIGIGLILFLIPWSFTINITDDFNLFYLNGIVKRFSSDNKLSFYILLILLSSIAAYFPDHLNKHNHTKDKISAYLLFILLFFSVSVVFGYYGSFKINFYFITFAYLYLFIYGILNVDKKPYNVLLAIVILHILGLLFLERLSIEALQIKYSYVSFTTLFTMFFAYLVGRNWKKSLAKNNLQISKFEYIGLPFLLFLIVFEFVYPIELTKEAVKYVFLSLFILYGFYKYINKKNINILEVSIFITFILIGLLYAGGDIAPIEPTIEGAKSVTHPSSIFHYSPNIYLTMFLGLYLGIKYRKIGIMLSIVLFISLLIINLMYNFEVKDLHIKTGELILKPNFSLGYYIKLVIFAVLGYISTKVYSNKIYYDKQIIVSSSAKIIYRLWLFIVLFFPVIFIIAAANSRADLNIANEMYTNNVYFGLFVFVLTYFIIIYLPILISEGIVRRNGVIFNQSNFPQYSDIHQLLDKDFGKDRQELYIISPNKILLWGILTSRVFKIYAAINPVLLSSVFNQITKDEEQLLFLTYKQYSKVKLGHIKLWWYMYIVTFVPVLNILYFYAKRITYQNSLLYTYIELKKQSKTNIQNALDSTVTEETEAGISNVSQHGIKVNGVRNIFFLWLSYFVSRPHLQTQLYLLKAYHDKESEIIEKHTSLGYHFSFKNKNFKIDKYLAIVLSVILSILIIIGSLSLKKEPIIDDIAPVEPIVEVPIPVEPSTTK